MKLSVMLQPTLGLLHRVPERTNMVSSCLGRPRRQIGALLIDPF